MANSDNLTGGGSPGPAALTPDEAKALMRECYAHFSEKLHESLRDALEVASDLFETKSLIPDGEIQTVREELPTWSEKFEALFRELFEQRMAGQMRKGRRPDADASPATLQVMSPLDQEKQAALVHANILMQRITKRELDALELRIGELLGVRPGRNIDNPFSPAYILDALGPTSRAVFPNPRVWRSLMERIITDLTPDLNKIYISLNRLLGDRGVLPEIKAELRARSEWRPADDKDLLPTFTRMLSEVESSVPTDIVVPPASSIGESPPSAANLPPFPSNLAAPAAMGSATDGATASTAGASSNVVPPAAILAGLATLAALGARAASSQGAPPDASDGTSGNDFPSLDASMAFGSLTPAISTLGYWQRVDLQKALAEAIAQPAGEAATLPINLVPHIRAAVADQVDNPADRISMDVIALLFDYVFRDPSIADSQRRVFSRLQVPIVKAALLDRAFFSERKHPARQLLDILADAAIGATGDEGYRAAFDALATEVVDSVSRDFETDVAIFDNAVAKVQAFVDAERHENAPALNVNVAAALADEEHEADRAQVRALLRDRLAGLDLPFEVRSFTETVWADYLTTLRKAHGGDSPEWSRAQQTLDDLLWSIVAKERTAQKARLTKMIPSLVTALRKGCTTLALPAARSSSFFETLYDLHVAAINYGKDTRSSAAPQVDAVAGADDSGAVPTLTAPATIQPPANVHDFVSEMLVGTWLSFDGDGEPTTARLSWVSPMRSKYIFTSRSRVRAFVMTPEELAWKLVNGKASLVVEPVPLFDRAVSSALDTLAARKARPASARAVAASATIH